MPRLARLVAQGVALLLLLLGLLVGPIIFFSALNTFMLLGTSWNGDVFVDFVANGWHGKDQGWPSHCVGSKRLTMLDPIISCNGTYSWFVHQSETELWWSCISPGWIVDKEGFGQPSILSSCSIMFYLFAIQKLGGYSQRQPLKNWTHRMVNWGPAWLERRVGTRRSPNFPAGPFYAEPSLPMKPCKWW